MTALGTALIICSGPVGAAVGAGLLLMGEAEMQEGTSLKSLAEKGDFKTEPDNFLKKILPDPAYTLVKTGLCVVGSVMLAGPAVLCMGGFNVGIELGFDLINGNLKSWQHYLDTFSKGCMVGAITGPLQNLGKMLDGM